MLEMLTGTERFGAWIGIVSSVDVFLGSSLKTCSLALNLNAAKSKELRQVFHVHTLASSRMMVLRKCNVILRGRKL